LVDAKQERALDLNVTRKTQTTKRRLTHPNRRSLHQPAQHNATISASRKGPGTHRWVQGRVMGQGRARALDRVQRVRDRMLALGRADAAAARTQAMPSYRTTEAEPGHPVPSAYLVPAPCPCVAPVHPSPEARRRIPAGPRQDLPGVPSLDPSWTPWLGPRVPSDPSAVPWVPSRVLAGLGAYRA